MTDWGAFAGFSGVVVAFLLLLARASQSVVSAVEPEEDAPTHERDLLEDPADEAAAGPRPAGAREGATPPEPAAGRDGTDAPEPAGAPEEMPGPEPAAARGETAPSGPAGAAEESLPAEPAPGRERATGAETPPSPPESAPSDDPAADRPAHGGEPPGRLQSIGSGELLANVLLTHGLFAGLVVGAAVYWRVPPSALGVSVPSGAAVAWGVAAGVALYAANEVGAAAAARLGVDHDEGLRELLAPGTPAGWALLLGGALPVVAVAEELLFRGVLVGALAAGFGLPVWGLAAASSAAFALGHGAQGRGGVLVTGALGFALAAAFVLSGSLALVVVAHYVVNALEFVVHEGLGVEWVE